MKWQSIFGSRFIEFFRVQRRRQSVKPMFVGHVVFAQKAMGLVRLPPRKGVFRHV